MRNFFTTIFNAISSFDFYREVPEKSFWKTIGFYALLLAFISLIRVFPVIFTSLPQLQTDISQSIIDLRTHYPADLVINWNEGKLTASNNPQAVYYPSNFKTYFSQEKTPPLFALINTNETEASPSADAIFTITQTDILTRAENNDINRLPLIDVIGESPRQVDVNFLADLQSTWEKQKNNLLRLAQVILPVILYFLFLFQRIGMILIESILFLLFKRVQGRPWSYATAIKYAIFFFVAAEFIDIVAGYIYPQSAVSLFSLTVWLYFLAVSFFMPRRKFI